MAHVAAKVLKVGGGSQLPYVRPQSVEALVRSGEVDVGVDGRSGIGAAVWVDVQSMPFADYYYRYIQLAPMSDAFYMQFQSAAGVEDRSDEAPYTWPCVDEGGGDDFDFDAEVARAEAFDAEVARAEAFEAEAAPPWDSWEGGGSKYDTFDTFHT
jgi:hypothetical protein